MLSDNRKISATLNANKSLSIYDHSLSAFLVNGLNDSLENNDLQADFCEVQTLLDWICRQREKTAKVSAEIDKAKQSYLHYRKQIEDFIVRASSKSNSSKRNAVTIAKLFLAKHGEK